jgi:2,5-diketo-D-gluconate reductase B
MQAKDFNIPKIGLGTYALNGENCINAIADALDMGYRHIDTAQYYNNEAEVGKGIKKSKVQRDEVFITTKIWPSQFPTLLDATEKSLKRLQVEQVDLLLLHWPADDEANKKATDRLFEAQQKGFAKYIGVSNFNIKQLTTALKQAPIVANQVEYHPMVSQDKMLGFLRQHQLELIAYSPLGMGQVIRNKTLMKIAQKYKKTSSQVVLRWLTQQDRVSAIPKSSSSERRKENLEIFDFELEEEDMMTIFSLNCNQRMKAMLGRPSGTEHGLILCHLN